MTDKPNVILFLIDDLGWADLSCFGSTFYETPHLDALAADSMLFTDAYAACPVCSPSRASILTGKYPARLGITNYIDVSGNYHPLKGRLIDVPYKKELPHCETTLATAMHDAGYRTYHIGKWHLGEKDYYPQSHGFDVNVGGCEWGHPHRGYFSPWGIPSFDPDVADGTYLTDYLTDRALALIETPSEQPFFLNMWYYSVHTPIEAKPEIIAKYRDKMQRLGLPEHAATEIIGPNVFLGDPDQVIRQRLQQSMPAYAAMLENLDHNIGRIITQLKDSGQYDNTVIIFSSDNGGLSTMDGPRSENRCGVTNNAPLKYGKAWMSDGGIRVPQMIRWPGHTRAGSRCATPVTSTDFYPSILEMIGAAPRPQQHCDGESLCPLLEESGPLKRQAIFWHFPHYHCIAQSPGSAVRKGAYKLIEYYDGHSYELYNLDNDIGESTDLCAQEPAVFADLKQELDSWKNSVCAQVPEKNPDWADLDFDPYSDPNGAFV